MAIEDDFEVSPKGVSYVGDGATYTTNELLRYVVDELTHRMTMPRRRPDANQIAAATMESETLGPSMGPLVDARPLTQGPTMTFEKWLDETAAILKRSSRVPVVDD